MILSFDLMNWKVARCNVREKVEEFKDRTVYHARSEVEKLNVRVHLIIREKCVKPEGNKLIIHSHRTQVGNADETRELSIVFQGVDRVDNLIKSVFTADMRVRSVYTTYKDNENRFEYAKFVELSNIRDANAGEKDLTIIVKNYIVDDNPNFNYIYNQKGYFGSLSWYEMSPNYQIHFVSGVVDENRIKDDEPSIFTFDLLRQAMGLI